MTWLTILTLTCSCASSYNLSAWQETTSVPREQSLRGTLELDLAAIDNMRASRDLAASRELALRVVAENPESVEALWRAARAESDAVFLFHDHEEEQRSLAALSALDYAHRANAGGNPPVEARAELAWALGTTTHLQPMMGRSKHAQKTADAITAALAIDPDNPTAHITNALLNYRLKTLPAMVKLMARSAPKSSLDTARSEAEKAIELLPNLQNTLIYARILAGQGHPDSAIAALDEYLQGPDSFPRDREIRAEATAYLKELREEQQAQ